MNYDNVIKLHSRVRHDVLGEGRVVKINDRFTSVAFDGGEERNFTSEVFNTMGFFTINEDNVDEVKIVNIRVKQLFDRLDYDIGIRPENCVSILSAPNGCGKTTIFKILNFMFNPNLKNYDEIKEIPFENFECSLSNGCTLSLCYKRTVNCLAEDECDTVFSITDADNQIKEICYLDAGTDEYSTYGCYNDTTSGDAEYMNRIIALRNRRFFSMIESAIIEKRCMTDLDFIVANRLQKEYVLKNKKYPRASASAESEKVDYLKFACDEMLSNIINWRERYNSLSEIAKSKLPSMYVAAADDLDITFEEFEQRWNNYHRELSKFYELGILEAREALIEADKLKEAFEHKKTFLLTYLDAFEGTLAPLQENYAKLKLFADIFHKRNEITRKRILFTPGGIEIFSHGKKIDMNCMSSGEKNDFVMFYRLIFDTSLGGIVLIDEPEISLHIEWQEEYLDRLINICEMNKLQAIVATHSPNIVNYHFDLFVDKR